MFCINKATFCFYNENNEETRQIDTAKINVLQQEKDLLYINKKAEPFLISNWLKQQFQKFIEWVTGKNLNQNQNESLYKFWNLFSKIIFWALIIFAVLMIVSNLLGVKFTSLFLKKHDIKENIFYDVLKENINEINFDNEIKKHLEDKNYRYVIRLHYLKSLKILSDKNLINWQKYKTNKEYLTEIKNNDLKIAFKKISTLFNYTWYGKFLVDENNLQNYILQFNNFNKNIK